MGVTVEAGVLKTGTPLCVPSKAVSVSESEEVLWVCVSGLVNTLSQVFLHWWTISFVPFVQFVDIGIVTSIEMNHKPVDTAKKGQEICVKIEPIPGESPKMYGRHFEAVDMIVSKVRLCLLNVCYDIW